MKFDFKFSYILLFGLFLMGAFQVYNVLYIGDSKFNSQMENQLISIVQIKGERINDYFLERKHDAKVLGYSSEVKAILNGESGYDYVSIEENMKRRLEIISGQVDIFIKKYPTISLLELQQDEDFKKIIFKKFGDDSGMVLINSDDNSILLDEKTDNIGKSFSEVMGINDGYFKNLNLKTGDNINLGLGFIIYSNDFKISKNISGDLFDYVNSFKEISNYNNLLLIDKNGYVVHEVINGFEFGTNLESVANNKDDLGVIYSEVKISGKEVIHGPYMIEGIDGFKMILTFASPVYSNDEFVGVVFLNVLTNYLNEMTVEKTGLGKYGEAYLLNEEKLLITKLGEDENNILVQEISNVNSEKCFDNKNSKLSSLELISISKDFVGDNVYGTYAYIEETDWCLVSEVKEDAVIELPKEGRTVFDLVIVLILNLGLFFGGTFLMNKMGGNKK
ncbi:cache domain-containing protein [Candidatus Pacearchaeota archaeon]|nr:cache domain-containing protein [Candidatus Pacearchaeota archaeon]